MKAMVLRTARMPLEWTDLPDPQPGPGEVRVAVLACGVCRTDLHMLDGELPDPLSPIILGHEIVGRIDALGAGVIDLKLGERVGIPWLGHTCGCAFIAGPSGKTSATRRYSPVILAKAALPQRRSPMRDFVSPLVRRAPISPWLHSCAQVSSDGGPCIWRAMVRGLVCTASARRRTS